MERVSSHHIRDLWRFADRYSIPWNLPTNFHPDLIATILQTHLLSLCVLLSQQSHLFPICVVLTYNDSRKIFTGFANFQRIVSVNDFRLPIRLQELLQAPLCFLRSFCFAQIRLDPLGGQVLHHDCISMIVSRFTTFTENFLIGCNQITKIFCTKEDSSNTSSARGPCDLGPLADLAISVFWEVSVNTMFTQIRTSRWL